MSTCFFDEANFYSVGLQEAQARVITWHQSYLGEYGKPVALLLTELDDPAGLAARIEGCLVAEAAPLLRLCTEHDNMIEDFRKEMKEFQKEHPHDNPQSAFHPSSAHEFFDRPSPPFTGERKALDRALAEIEEQRRRYRRLLAARKADIAVGLTQRGVDPNEEPDPILRIAALRLREAIDAQKDFQKEAQKRMSHTRRLLDIRKRER